MKTRISAKIGTHSSTILVLWNDKPYKIGDIIFGMEYNLYDSLHSQVRDIKKYRFWNQYLVTDLDPLLFISKI